MRVLQQTCQLHHCFYIWNLRNFFISTASIYISAVITSVEFAGRIQLARINCLRIKLNCFVVPKFAARLICARKQRFQRRGKPRLLIRVSRLLSSFMYGGCLLCHTRAPLSSCEWIASYNPHKLPSIGQNWYENQTALRNALRFSSGVCGTTSQPGQTASTPAPFAARRASAI